MKKVTFFLLGIALLGACKNSIKSGKEKTPEAADTVAVETEASRPEISYYGDSIDDAEAIEASQVLALLEGKDSLQVKLKGTINSSCKRKGCWMKMDLGNGEEMRVSFRDYEFFVPKNLNGETAIIEGVAYRDTLDVDFLRHLAEDAGKSEEEIAAITEPEISINYTANGVIIRS